MWIRNYFLSILFHLILLISFFILYNWQNDQSKINSIIFSLDTQEYFIEKSTLEEKTSEEKFKPVSETPIQEFDEIQAVSMTDINADTTNLDQIYSESSLNVKIKYPKGWTFLDQSKNKKLEGVTFWVNDGSINPPPYLYLEVVDKDMFIEQRFKYKTEFKKYLAYYNDPEEMQGYITRVIYIRTEDDEDFKLKLMMKGKNEFESFEPKFWAILKSFDFGTSIF